MVHGSRAQGAEVFDPLTEIFTSVGPFVDTHACVRAERLADGRVLVIDGYARNPLTCLHRVRTVLQVQVRYLMIAVTTQVQDYRMAAC